MLFEECGADSCFYTPNAVELVKQAGYSGAQSGCQERRLQGRLQDEASDALSLILDLGKQARSDDVAKKTKTPGYGICGRLGAASGS